MPSKLTWLAYSEHERQRTLDAVRLMHESDTRDELGLAGVRDAFAEFFFPGTNTIQAPAELDLLARAMDVGYSPVRSQVSSVSPNVRLEV